MPQHVQTTASTHHTPFRYSKLGHERCIRLLKLVPWFPGREYELRCSIIDTTIDDAPRYNALSYTWGSPEKSATLLIDGQALPITTGLATALLHCQWMNCAEPMWIDQICINQEDLDEKTSQIQLMKDIYQKAYRVTIWLGEGDSTLRQSTARGLIEVAKSFTTRGTVKWMVFSLRALVELPLRRESHSRKLAEHLHEWKKVFGHADWFRRVWILQEAIFGSNILVMRGLETMPWDMICDGATNINGYRLYQRSTTPINLAIEMTHKMFIWSYFVGSRKRRPRYLDGFQSYSGERKAERTPPTLLEVLYETSNSLCSDPRDRIYGIQSLTVKDDSLPLIPDYRLSTAEVYYNVARHIIEHDQSLDILRYIEYPKSIETCSWVPDWTFGDNENVNWRRRGHIGRIFYYTIPSVQLEILTYNKVATFSDDGRSLLVRGKILYTIIATSGSTFYAPNYSTRSFDADSDLSWIPSAVETLKKWFILMVKHSAFPTEPVMIPKKQKEERSLGTYFMGALTLLYVVQDEEDRSGYIHEYEREGSIFTSNASISTSPQFNGDKLKTSHVTHHARGRTICIASPTSSSRLSNSADIKQTLVLSPPITAVGDQVVVLRGVRVPLIIRRIGLNGEKWQVIGPCYVHEDVYSDRDWRKIEDTSLDQLDGFILE